MSDLEFVMWVLFSSAGVWLYGEISYEAGFLRGHASGVNETRRVCLKILDGEYDQI